MPSLRKRALDPEIELHPDTAAARGITAGSWVAVETPAGGMRARTRLNDKLDPRVVVGEHGWWQGCEELHLAGYDPFSSQGANFNGTVDAAIRDPISGTPSHGGQSVRGPLDLAHAGFSRRYRDMEMALITASGLSPQTLDRLRSKAVVLSDDRGPKVSVSWQRDPR
jgi:hypothetical protein